MPKECSKDWPLHVLSGPVGIKQRSLLSPSWLYKGGRLEATITMKDAYAVIVRKDTMV